MRPPEPSENARFLRSLPRHHPGAFAIELVAHDIYATVQARWSCQRRTGALHIH
jgi:hypothetical protein